MMESSSSKESFERELEIIKKRYREEALRAVRDAEERGFQKGLQEGKNSCSDEARKWKAVADALISYGSLDEAPFKKAPSLVKYIMEQVFRDTKSEFSSETEKDIVSRMKNVLLFSTNALLEKLPGLILLRPQDMATIKNAEKDSFGSNPTSLLNCITTSQQNIFRKYCPYPTVFSVSISIPKVKMASKRGYFKEGSVALYVVEASILMKDGTVLQTSQDHRYSDFVGLYQGLSKSLNLIAIPTLTASQSSSSTISSHYGYPATTATSPSSSNVVEDNSKSLDAVFSNTEETLLTDNSIMNFRQRFLSKWLQAVVDNGRLLQAPAVLSFIGFTSLSQSSSSSDVPGKHDANDVIKADNSSKLRSVRPMSYLVKAQLLQDYSVIQRQIKALQPQYHDVLSSLKKLTKSTMMISKGYGYLSSSFNCSTSSSLPSQSSSMQTLSNSSYSSTMIANMSLIPLIMGQSQSTTAFVESCGKVCTILEDSFLQMAILNERGPYECCRFLSDHILEADKVLFSSMSSMEALLSSTSDDGKVSKATDRSEDTGSIGGSSSGVLEGSNVNNGPQQTHISTSFASIAEQWSTSCRYRKKCIHQHMVDYATDMRRQHQRAMENLSELLFSLQTVEPAIPKYSDRVSMKLIEEQKASLACPAKSTMNAAPADNKTLSKPTLDRPVIPSGSRREPKNIFGVITRFLSSKSTSSQEKNDGTSTTSTDASWNATTVDNTGKSSLGPSSTATTTATAASSSSSNPISTSTSTLSSSPLRQPPSSTSNSTTFQGDMMSREVSSVAVGSEESPQLLSNHHGMSNSVNGATNTRRKYRPTVTSSLHSNVSGPTFSEDVDPSSLLWKSHHNSGSGNSINTSMSSTATTNPSSSSSVNSTSSKSKGYFATHDVDESRLKIPTISVNMQQQQPQQQQQQPQQPQQQQQQQSSGLPTPSFVSPRKENVSGETSNNNYNNNNNDDVSVDTKDIANPLFSNGSQDDDNSSWQKNSTSNAPFNLSKDDESLPDGWEKGYTEEGRPYYYHNVERVARWDPPTPQIAALVEERVQGHQRRMDEALRKRKQELEQSKEQELERNRALEDTKSVIDSLIADWKYRPINTSKSNPMNGGDSRSLRDLSELLIHLPSVNTLITLDMISPSIVELGMQAPAAEIKKQYMKVVRIIHPDKLSAITSPEQRLMTEAIFITLSEAYDQWKNSL